MVTGPRKGDTEILAWLVGRTGILWVVAASAGVLVVCGSVVFCHTPIRREGFRGFVPCREGLPVRASA